MSTDILTTWHKETCQWPQREGMNEGFRHERIKEGNTQKATWQANHKENAAADS